MRLWIRKLRVERLAFRVSWEVESLRVQEVQDYEDNTGFDG